MGHGLKQEEPLVNENCEDDHLDASDGKSFWGKDSS